MWLLLFSAEDAFFSVAVVAATTTPLAVELLDAVDFLAVLEECCVTSENKYTKDQLTWVNRTEQNRAEEGQQR